MERTYRKFSRLGLLLVLISMLLAIGAPASAATMSTGKATAASAQASDVSAIIEELSQAANEVGKNWSELTPEEQKAVEESLTATTVKTEVESDAVATDSPDACRYVTVSRYYTNVFGNRLFTYYQRVDWCYNGSNITSVSRSRWGEVGAPFWEFKGHIGSSTTGGAGRWSYSAFTQGSFALCMPYVLCAQHKYPWIRINVYGNGGYSYSTGG